MLRKIKPATLCFGILSGILLNLPFSTGNLWVFAWIGFLPLFFALQNKKPLAAFLISFFTGIVFWTLTVFWLIHVTLIGLVLLVLYLALYFGLFGLIISSSSLVLRPSSFVFFIPALWVILEYLWAHLLTGFGWAFLGYSQYLNLPVIQIADITGVYGVSFLVMMVNVTIWRLLIETRGQKSVTRKIWIHSLVAGFWLLVSVTYGFFRLHQKIEGRHLRVSVIQGNIPQELKWMPGAQGFILDRYIRLTESASSDSPDLVVWPESSSPGFLGEDDWVFQRISDLARRIKIPILIGTVVVEDRKYFNSAVLMDKSGEITRRYDKLHLVPFGEYVPLKKIFSFLETVVPIGDFTAGKEYTLFQLPITYDLSPVNFGVLICFEDTVSELSRNFVKRQADFLVNITNDGWYKQTPAAYQHLSASVFRALENRIPLVRSANTGVSCFIDSNGRITSRVLKDNKDIFVDGFKTQMITLNKTVSIYRNIGDLFVLSCFALAIFYGIIIKLKVRLSAFKH